MTHFRTGSTDRDAVLEYLRRQLIGPVDGPDELLEDRPNDRYLSGVLYPRPQDAYVAVAEDEDGEPATDDVGAVGGDTGDDDPVTMAGQHRPSSAGISFMTSTRSEIIVEIRLGLYADAGDSQWQRTQVTLAGEQAVRLTPRGDGVHTATEELPGVQATVRVKWRRQGAGAVVTVVLVNGRLAGDKGVEPADCLYQVDIRCTPAEGAITPYPRARHQATDAESAELQLQYRQTAVYAVGHGAAACWEEDGGNRWVRTTFLPHHVVPDVRFDLPPDSETPDRVFRLARLAEVESATRDVVADLHTFVDGYQAWVRTVRATVGRLDEPHLVGAGNRLMDRAERAIDRMRRGVALLSDPAERLAVRAFALAHRAMVMQMVHSGPRFAGSPHAVPDAPVDFDVDYAGSQARWRPFQLGFLLLNLEGVLRAGPDRDVVDLIWFPTGGGKTEAYLGLAAFTIFHRRLEHGDAGAGTTIITRYTLRLLTAQQFQRAATLIAACELLRREHRNELGSRPISIGIWVGGKNTPNSYAEASKLAGDLKSGKTVEQGFQIDICPWCGTRIVPSEPGDPPEWGIVANNNAFRVHCVNRRCPFAQNLPVSSVDEALFDDPPTMLVGTVDKFARMVWDARSGVFFGAGDDPGPSLIIQDEFHLISGPLGTIVGLYEAAFDVLMRHHGAHPKIVAATATIRNADEQTRGVFGREVALFPPAGVDSGDSYFIRADPDGPGRAYAGVMPQGHRPVTALVHLASAQLQAPRETAIASPAILDSYSTLVVYHNSLRELGKTMTLALDDIPSRIRVIAAAEDDMQELDDHNVVELTSNVSSAEVATALRRLAEPAETGIAFLASTSMISVGVDVTRLGLMTVVGQPKTTAEYIQATSRVGRKSKERPGLVVTLYSPAKPRDRSHYESFVPYHAALYRAVEPTSVTPFSVSARGRALHADLVVLVRHALGLRENDAAARFGPDDGRLRSLIEEFVLRAAAADPDEADSVAAHLRKLVDEWSRAVAQAAADGGLRYSAGPNGKPRLLRRYGDKGGTWSTLQSMRSVDAEVAVWPREWRHEKRP